MTRGSIGTQTVSWALSLLAAILVVGRIGGAASAATVQDEGPIPDLAVAQMVRLSLEAEFAKAPLGTTVYLVNEGMRAEWIPSDLPVRVILITVKDSYRMQDTGERYYAFTDPMRREFGYSIGLVHLDGTEMRGPAYHFAETDGEVRSIPTEEVVTVIGCGESTQPN